MPLAYVMYTQPNDATYALAIVRIYYSVPTIGVKYYSNKQKLYRFTLKVLLINVNYRHRLQSFSDHHVQSVSMYF